MSKKLIFDETNMVFYNHGHVKTDGHTIDISNIPQRMNEQLQKFYGTLSVSSFKNQNQTNYLPSTLLSQYQSIPPFVQDSVAIKR